MKRLSLTIAVLLLPLTAGAQQPTVSPFVQRALSRDTTLTVWLFVRPERSLADVAALVTQAGGQVRRVSRWLHAVSASVSTGAIATLRRRPELARIQPVARFVNRVEPGVQAAPAFTPAPGADDFGPSIMPFNRLNLMPLVNRNFRGQGVKIAILDTGFETGLSVFTATTVIAQRDFINDDGVVRNEAGDFSAQSSHGTSTWSLLGANQQSTIIGIAPAAQYILAKTENVTSEMRTEEDDYVAALEWADSLGAKIVSSSLGYFDFDGGFTYTRAQLNGDFAVTTLAVDIAAQKGITVVTAMGNDGPGFQTISTPADADSAIAVGAVDSLGNLASFSSRGPTADGRIKPDVTAPGVAVWLATPSGFGRSNGTSFSTPITAGAAALLKQIHPTFGPIDIRDALRAAGSNARMPDSNRGWGTPDVAAAATFPRGIIVQAPRDSVLASVTPDFSWTTPDIPAFGLPARYRLTVTSDAGFATAPLLDTTLTGTSVTMNRVLRPGTTVYFRIIATGADSASLTLTRGPFVAPREDVLPMLTLLFQNFPNPFPDRNTGRRSTCIWFDLATGGRVRLDIVDMRGHVVRNLIPGSAFGPDLPAGHYGRSGADCDPALQWDGTAASGTVVQQGIYLAKLVTPDGVLFKRIVFLGPGIF